MPVKIMLIQEKPDSKVHGTNMGPTWILPAPDGPHACPMNLGIRELLTDCGHVVPCGDGDLGQHWFKVLASCTI